MNKDPDIKSEKRRAELARIEFWSQVIDYQCLHMDYEYDTINPSHFRLYRGEKVIDLFPVGMRYHKLWSDKRGHVEDVEAFIIKEFRPGAITKGLHKSSARSNKKKWETTVITFGKHKGKKLHDIPHQYLEFIYTNNYCPPSLWKILDKNKEKFFK